MYPTLFTLGSFTFTTHGLFAVLGIILGSVILYNLAKREKLKTDFLFDNIVYMVLSGIVGARLTYFFLYRDQFSDLKEIFYLWNGGMVSYGGFILAAVTLFTLLYYQREAVIKWFDLLAISFAFGLFLGRLGNVLAGEYAGYKSSGLLNIGGYIPVTLFEGIFVLIVFILLLIIYLRDIFKADGQFLALFLIFYGLGRFVIDFWRDEPTIIMSISLGQSVSLMVLILGIYIFYRKKLLTLEGRK